MAEYVCCYCAITFEAESDGPQCECPECERVVPTERRDHYEDRVGKDAGKLFAERRARAAQ